MRQTREELTVNPGPYTAYQISMGSQESRWDVMGSTGISTGYIGLFGNSGPAAMAEAFRLNKIWSEDRS